MSASSCARVREILPLYLEHESDPAEALEAARHLVACSRCAEDAERGRAVVSALRDLDSPAPPADLSARVMARLRTLKANAAGTGALKWSALGALVGLLLVEGTLPTPVRRIGLRLLASLGELIDLDYLLSRLIESVSRLLPSPSSLFERLAGMGASMGRLPGQSAPGHAAVMLLIGALATLLLTGLMIVSAVAVLPSARRLGSRVLRRF